MEDCFTTNVDKLSSMGNCEFMTVKDQFHLVSAAILPTPKAIKKTKFKKIQHYNYFSKLQFAKKPYLCAMNS